MDLNNQLLVSIDSKLSLISKLLFEKGDKTLREKVSIMANLPISSKSAAEILGTSEGTYNKEKSIFKTKQKSEIVSNQSIAQEDLEKNGDGQQLANN